MSQGGKCRFAARRFRGENNELAYPTLWKWRWLRRSNVTLDFEWVLQRILTRGRVHVYVRTSKVPWWRLSQVNGSLPQWAVGRRSAAIVGRLGARLPAYERDAGRPWKPSGADSARL